MPYGNMTDTYTVITISVNIINVGFAIEHDYQSNMVTPIILFRVKENVISLVRYEAIQ